jgi:hypothetical protein
MRKISSDEATIDNAFEVAQLMIEEGNTEQGVQLLRAAEIALVMRHGQLTEGLCPNDGKNIAPRLRPPLRRRQRAKSRLRRGSRLRNWSENGSDSGEFPFKR